MEGDTAADAARFLSETGDSSGAAPAAAPNPAPTPDPAEAPAGQTTAPAAASPAPASGDEQPETAETPKYDYSAITNQLAASDVPPERLHEVLQAYQFYTSPEGDAQLKAHYTKGYLGEVLANPQAVQQLATLIDQAKVRHGIAPAAEAQTDTGYEDPGDARVRQLEAQVKRLSTALEEVKGPATAAATRLKNDDLAAAQVDEFRSFLAMEPNAAAAQQELAEDLSEAIRMAPDRFAQRGAVQRYARERFERRYRGKLPPARTAPAPNGGNRGPAAAPTTAAPKPPVNETAEQMGIRAAAELEAAFANGR